MILAASWRRETEAGRRGQHADGQAGADVRAGLQPMFAPASSREPSSANTSDSQAHVDHVVYPPVKPAESTTVGLCANPWCSASPVTSPSNSDPVMLIANVPHGKTESCQP